MPTVRVGNVDEVIADLQRRGLVADDAPRRPMAPTIAQAEPVKAKKPRPATTVGPVEVTTSFTVYGLILKSEANIRGDSRAYMARKAAVKQAMGNVLESLLVQPMARPVKVKLVRLGGKLLDDDNLQHCFKVCRDVIANEWLQCDDGDRNAVLWSYDQQPDYKAGIRVEVRG